MLFRTSLVMAALLTQGALAVICTAGNYRPTANGICQACPDGYYRNTVTPNGQASTCTACPAGQTNAPDRKSCKNCDPGKYNDSEGSTCKPCAAGSFNNVPGAKSCCQCCAGYYQSDTGKTSCTPCPNIGPAKRPYSDIGSDNNNDCKADKGTLPDPATSCDMMAQNKCPNPTGPGSVGSPIARKKRDVVCTKGFQACPRYAGRGGFDCVDTTSDPESCGGCVGLDGSGSGTDCTAIKGVSVTRCVNRSCVIDSCRKGWVKSIDGTSCVLASRTTGSGPETPGLYAQDVDSKKKRTSAKRAIRANIY